MSKTATTIPEWTRDRISELLERVEMKTSQRYRWVIFAELPAWMRLSSFLNSYVRELPTERRQAGMNERNGGRGVRKCWKLGHEGEERENKSPSEEDDASWLEKQQGILSPTLPACSYLWISPVALLSPPPPTPRSVTSLCSAEMHGTHVCTLLSFELRSRTCLHAHPAELLINQPWWDRRAHWHVRHPATKQPKLIQTACCPSSIKDPKIRISKTERGEKGKKKKLSQVLAQRTVVLIKLGNQFFPSLTAGLLCL